MINYKIININLTSVTSDEPVESVPCGSCTLCCSQLAPHLTPEEVASGLYPLSLIQPTEEQRKANPEVGPIVTLYRKKEGGCGMLIDNKCSIYDHRPNSCRQFDCRKSHHPNIPNMIDNETR
ncbi:MAG: YkgJ family cysteine cluster protein [Lentisphaerota bacterium]